MRITQTLIALLVVAFSLSGCHETDYEFWINPDGSGKVKINSVLPSRMSMSRDDISLDYHLVETVISLLANNKEITFWKDVKYEWRQDGKIQFSGEAYFKDISTIRLFNLEIPFRVQFESQPSDMILYEFCLDNQNEYLLNKEKDKSRNDDPSQWSEDEIQKKILLTRVEYQSSRKMISHTFAGMRSKIRLHVPGTIETASQIEQEGSQTLLFEWDTDEWMDRIDNWSQDDASIRRMVMSQQNLRQSITDPEFVREILFGQPNPMRAQIKSSNQPFFDFKQAADEYQAAYQEQLEQLKNKQKELNPWIVDLPTPHPTPEPTPTPGPFVEGDTFNTVEIIGVRHIKGENINIHTLGRQAYKPTFSIGIKATLLGIVEHFEEGRIEKAETLEGESLITDDRHFGKIQNILLSEQNTVASFDLHMAEPSPETKGIKVISGYIQHFIPGEERKIILEEKELMNGQHWNQLNTQIVHVGISRRISSRKEIHLQFESNSLSIKDVKFLDKNGAAYPILLSDRYEKGPLVTFRFFCNVPLPESASIILEVYDSYRFGKVPFKIENIDLLGRPLSE